MIDGHAHIFTMRYVCNLVDHFGQGGLGKLPTIYENGYLAIVLLLRSH